MNESLQVRQPGELSKADLEACILIIKEGGVVNVQSATVTLPRSIVVIKRVNSEVVGVGAIKPSRPDYAADKAQESGHALDSNMRELGYVAVRVAHRGQGISKEIMTRSTSSGWKAPERAAAFASTKWFYEPSVHRRLIMDPPSCVRSSFSGYEAFVGMPRLIQSMTSAG